MDNNIISNPDKYYIGETIERREVGTNKNLQKLATDRNNPIFSFNFGLSLLNSFVRIEFGDRNTGTFGVSILEDFII